jgi:hypothetical protein
MKRLRWQIMLAVSLVALSALLYILHHAIFHDWHHIFIYLLGDVAFIPIEVLIVTIIIHQLLSFRERKALLNKLNMVIGAFFSEVGTRLLKSLVAFDPDVGALGKELLVGATWGGRKFSAMRKRLEEYAYPIDPKRGNIAELAALLTGERNFLVGLLENQTLLEHERFTNLLWAVFHLSEELACRKDVTRLADTDAQHIAGDMKRVYALLVIEWLAYMEHLEKNYPYLFSLAMRTNPFDPKASVEVR